MADTDELLPLVRQYESGNRNIPNYRFDPGHTAQGYYQITNTNWRNIAPQLGIDLHRYPSAMWAPMGVQTQVADYLLNQTPQGIGNWANYNPRLSAALSNLPGAPSMSEAQDQAKQPEYVLPDGKTTLRFPAGTSGEEIEKFINKNYGKGSEYEKSQMKTPEGVAQMVGTPQLQRPIPSGLQGPPSPLPGMLEAEHQGELSRREAGQDPVNQFLLDLTLAGVGGAQYAGYDPRTGAGLPSRAQMADVPAAMRQGRLAAQQTPIEPFMNPGRRAPARILGGLVGEHFGGPFTGLAAEEVVRQAPRGRAFVREAGQYLKQQPFGPSAAPPEFTPRPPRPAPPWTAGPGPTPQQSPPVSPIQPPEGYVRRAPAPRGQLPPIWEGLTTGTPTPTPEAAPPISSQLPSGRMVPTEAPTPRPSRTPLWMQERPVSAPKPAEPVVPGVVRAPGTPLPRRTPPEQVRPDIGPRPTLTDRVANAMTERNTDPAKLKGDSYRDRVKAQKDLKLPETPTRRQIRHGKLKAEFMKRSPGMEPHKLEIVSSGDEDTVRVIA